MVHDPIGSIPNRRLQVNRKVHPPNQSQWIESGMGYALANYRTLKAENGSNIYVVGESNMNYW
jgi:hypothetical protein